MASSKDFEKIWESYQDAVKTRSVSIVDYCQRNGIVYAQFQRWYKKHVGSVSLKRKRRASKDVTDTLTALYTHARKALRQKGKKYSDLMGQALNYMLNGWDELQTYRKDGRYTIDNLPAERAIRPFTVSRKRSTLSH